MANLTSVSGFLLMGFSADRKLQILHALLFLVTYLLALTGNLLIITITTLDHRLHSPMYYFLKHLSLLDLCFISVTVPQSIANSLMNNGYISLGQCILQVFFFIALASSEVAILTVMSYDRYAAICLPLHYEVIMDPRALMLNQTSITEFLLLGMTDIQELQSFLFVIILIIYFVSVTGNGAILIVVISDPRLHSPMYFFLGNLSCLDICFSTVTLPKMLENFLSTHKAISFLGCISQLHFFHFLGSTEVMLLAVMAFDRFVAICKPLHYTVIMNHQVCIQMAVTVWIIGFFHALLHSVMTSRINFCGSNHIHHFFCDVKPLLKLACGDTDLNELSCSDTHLNEELMMVLTGLLGISPLLCIISSYAHIFLAVARVPSAQGKKKALATCSSHLSMVILFYSSVFATYLKSPSASHASGELGAAIMYTLVTPTLNPFIYSLRNRDVKRSLKRILGIESSWH
ncbi:unnamed protein product [Rangifer tarandus platyrhynchus]|uniref:G-protein coupled receptors family 1 profile domain-containing protein n=2 Tax=Rangifer tarandus platyrhynchus TaxID=3082113 RepID=A0ABN8Z4G2_RANTA|nr:unnamed protein product [Rangifer tarandus platyrhynchus]